MLPPRRTDGGEGQPTLVELSSFGEEGPGSSGAEEMGLKEKLMCGAHASVRGGREKQQG